MAEGGEEDGGVPELRAEMEPEGDRGRKIPPEEEERGPIGLFPTWGWVYGTVLVYGAGTILILWLLTRVLDPGVGP